MSTTTQTIRSIAENVTGISLTVPNIAWRFSQWKVIAPMTNSEMLIQAIAFQVTRVTTADTTYEVLIEIGFGKVDNPTTVVQIPYSLRSDTAVGIYLDAKVFLPEPVVVPILETVCVRIANSTASADTINGIKLRVQDNRRPVQPNEQLILNNYKFVSSSSGISVTDKIR